MSKRTALILSRWVIALALIAKGALVLLKAASGGSGGYAESMAFALFAFAGVITGVIMLMPELAPWLVSPLWRFISGIVFPDERFDAPPVNYSLPRGYRERRRYDDAIEQYQKILRFHPRESAAYLECMEVMFQTGDIEGARQLLRRGQRKLRSADDRRALSERFATLLEAHAAHEREKAIAAGDA